MGVWRRGSMCARNLGSSFSRPITCSTRTTPLFAFTMTANMLDTDATTTNHFIHGANVAARSFHGVAVLSMAFVVARPNPTTSTQTQRT